VNIIKKALEVNRKSLTKNAYRITKKREFTALRVRVSGGHLDVEHFSIIQHIAEKYGNGSVHITTRQGFEIPDIDINMIPEINKIIAPLIKKLEISIGVSIDDAEKGYPAAGTRNIAACVGNRVCPFANMDTTALALRIEKEIYPNNFHVKVVVTGCPNDCIKSRMHDFGIVSISEPLYEYSRCIGCEVCVKNCKKKVTGALYMHNNKVKRDARRCIGCGECVLKCPTSAWTRNTTKFFDLSIMGRTGKKNPRLAERFIQWCSEDVVVKVIKNTYKYINEHIDRSLPKEHIGYIVDRTGFQVFKEFALDRVVLNPEAKLAKHINWSGFHYVSDVFLDSL
jgi:anaerobic sulfite reductase subunit C